MYSLLFSFNPYPSHVVSVIYCHNNGREPLQNITGLNNGGSLPMGMVSAARPSGSAYLGWLCTWAAGWLLGDPVCPTCCIALQQASHGKFSWQRKKCKSSKETREDFGGLDLEPMNPSILSYSAKQLTRPAQIQEVGNWSPPLY